MSRRIQGAPVTAKLPVVGGSVVAGYYLAGKRNELPLVVATGSAVYSVKVRSKVCYP